MQKVSTGIKRNRAVAKTFLDKILKKKSRLAGALVVGLRGELGAGKTAFTQALGRHLGIKSKMSSPTFVIIKKYQINHEGYKFLFHLDAYRLKNEKELLHIGWEEIIGNKEHLVIIEWPENVPKVMPKSTKYVDIAHTKEGHRSFTLVV